MVDYKIKTVSNQDELARLASHIISNHIRTVLQKKDRFQLSLAGGSTPCKTYTLLREERLPWHLVDIVLGDERWVPINDESSNAYMLKRTLLASGPGVKACFHPVPTTELNSPEDSALKFSQLIKDVCKGHPPRFDLILLGLGDDGHTASLFPATSSLTIKGSIATVGKGRGHERITLTPEVLSSAEKVVFLVSGKSKQVALKRLLDPCESPLRTPAKLVQPNSQILVLADKFSTEKVKII